MSEVIRAALVQARWACDKETMTKNAIRSVEQAAAQGARVVCLQEIFNGPYFCPARTPSGTTGRAGAGGPTTEMMRGRPREAPDGHDRARSTSASRRASTTTPPRSSTPTARYLGKYRKTHIPQMPGFWEKFFFKPGNLGYPGLPDALRQGRRLHLLRPALPGGRRALGLNGAEIVFNPSATVAGLSQYLWKLEQPAHAVANGYFVAAEQPRRHRAALEHRRVLRASLLRRPARPDRGDVASDRPTS